jgi:hypothetical protein
MNPRRALRDALYRATGPSPEEIQQLHAIGAPVYVVVRAGAALPGAGFPPGRGSVAGSFAAGDVDPLATSPEFERVYDTDDVRKAIQKLEAGDVATVRVLRGKNEDLTVDVKVESNDTWSGIGAPQRFRVRPDNTTMFDFGDDWHDNLGTMRRSLKEQRGGATSSKNEGIGRTERIRENSAITVSPSR